MGKTTAINVRDHLSIGRAGETTPETRSFRQKMVQAVSRHCSCSKVILGTTFGFYISSVIYRIVKSVVYSIYWSIALLHVGEQLNFIEF